MSRKKKHWRSVKPAPKPEVVKRQITPLLIVAGLAAISIAVFIPLGNSTSVPATTTAATAIEVPEIDTTVMIHRTAQVIDQTRNAILRNPQSAEAWGRLGQVFDAHALYDHAAPCYRRAMQLDPSDVRWPYNLGMVREFQGADVDEVMALFNGFARERPDYPPIFVRIGDVLSRQGRLVEARDAYRHAAELDPGLAVAHRGAGQAMLSLNELDGAVKHLERATVLVGSDGPALASLSQAYAFSGRIARARRTARKSRAFGTKSTINIPDPIRYQVASIKLKR